MDTQILDVAWRGALAVIPLALAVAAICRWIPARPSTRHTLWLAVFGLLVAAPVLALWAGAPSLISILPAPKDEVAEPRGPMEDWSGAIVADDAPAAPLPAKPTREGPATNRPWLARSEQPTLATFDLYRPPRTRGRAPAVVKSESESSAAPSLPPARVDRYLQGTAPGPSWLALPGDEVRTGPERHDARTAIRSRESEEPPVIAVSPPRPTAPEPAPAPASSAASTVIAGPPDETLSRGRTPMREWAVQLEVIRRAIMSLPPIPIGIWLGGGVLVGLVLMIRVVRSVRLIGRGRAASPSVIRMMERTAATLGLRRVPIVRMIDGCFSPMIWCGRRACLVLPTRLWEQLDEVGREAVMAHELAHLRRRDHWVSWFGVVIGSLYWWHPVVWWIRRRIQEEADLCCDAWVTSLLPAARRAYAQALLDTRKFTSDRSPLVPAIGLGASTARTKRFARRLTMVMTEQAAPRLSRRGLALVWTMTLAGVLVTPILACPPEKKDQPAPPAPKATLRFTRPAMPTPPSPPAPPAPATMPETTFEQYLRNRDGGDHENMSLEERLERLEQRLDRLHEALDRVFSSSPRAMALPHVKGVPVPAPSLMVVPRVQGVPMPGPAPAAPLLEVRTLPPGVSMGGVVGSIGCKCVCRGGDGSCCTVAPAAMGAKIYSNAVTGYATAMAAAGGADEQISRTYKLPEGKLELLTKLMVRSDVPILVEPGSEQIKVHGTDLEQAIFRAFVQLINPGDDEKAHSDAVSRADEDMKRSLAEVAQAYEMQAEASRAQKQGLEAWDRSIENQMRSLEREAAKLERRAAACESKGLDLKAKFDELHEQAEASDDDGAKDRALRRAEEMMVKAEQCFAEAEALQAQLEAIEMQMHALEDQARELEAQTRAAKKSPGR